MSSSAKGSSLEDKFYNFLLDQQCRGEFVYGAFAPELCKIYKKHKYFCPIREANVEFDVVVELFREGATTPHLFVIFECKNHQRAIEEDSITPFANKIGRIFPHASKGVLVVSSPLQSGAEKFARNQKLGIVKFDEQGFDVVVDRTGRSCVEQNYIKTQIFKNFGELKPLKFSAYFDGRFFGSFGEFIRHFDIEMRRDPTGFNPDIGPKIPFVSVEAIRDIAHAVLEEIDYKAGPVKLEEVCSLFSIKLSFSENTVHDADQDQILGTANFDERSIQINRHNNKYRERFTIAHEIGHFSLNHERYLRSETIIASDLFFGTELKTAANYQRLEYQANSFASELLLPESVFLVKVADLREFLDIRDKGHGYIFVDDQPCNYQSYAHLLSELSSYFEVSKQAIEIKLKKLGMLTDKRKGPDWQQIETIATDLLRNDSS